LLMKEENILQEGLPSLVKSHYRYNADGALVGVLTPDGVVTEYYYGRDEYLRQRAITDDEVRTDDDLTRKARMAFGNLLAVIKRGVRFDYATMGSNRGFGAWGDFFPDILAPTDAADIVTKFAYEVDFQQLLTSSDPRFTRNADPNDPETPRYHETLTRYEYRQRRIG